MVVRVCLCLYTQTYVGMLTLVSFLRVFEIDRYIIREQ